MHRLSILPVTVMLIAACGSSADPSEVITPPFAFTGRVGHAAVYDAARGRVVIFGGTGPGGGYSAQTLAWNGTAWSIVAEQGPAPREDALLAYDVARQRVVLHGGRTRAGSGQITVHTDTWELDGSVWTRVSTTGPAARTHAAFAYDAARARSVLFGGFGGDDARLTDTWAWNGTTWSRISDDLGADHAANAMTYDAAGQRLLLHTVYSTDADRGSGFQSSQLWQWGEAGWEGIGAGPRFSPAAPLVATHNGLVLYAGFDPGNSASTWTASAAGGWTQHAAPAPGRRRGAALVFTGQDALLIAGDDGTNVLADVWAWTGTAWTRR